MGQTNVVHTKLHMSRERVIGGLFFSVVVLGLYVGAGAQDGSPAIVCNAFDEVDWQISDPIVTWKLDQKIVKDLGESSTDAEKSTDALKKSFTKRLSLEGSGELSFSAGAEAKLALSFNPLALLGSRASARMATSLDVRAQIGGQLGWDAVRSTEAIEEYAVARKQAMSYMKAITEPKLQITVEFRNSSKSDLIYRLPEIPIMSGRNKLASARPSDQDKTDTILIPKERTIPKQFSANIDNTALWDFLSEEAAPLTVRLEQGEGQMFLGKNTTDLLAVRGAITASYLPVRVVLPGGGSLTWFVSRRVANDKTGGTRCIKAAEALMAIGEMVSKRTGKPQALFTIDKDGGFLLSACGHDSVLAGFEWMIAVDGQNLPLGADLAVPVEMSLVLQPGGPVSLKDPRYGTDLIRQASKGSSWARLILNGHLARAGQGVERKIAFDVIRTVADAERKPLSGYAGNQLGNCYANGYGVAKDEAEAVKWYRKTAEQGSAAAQLLLGCCYARGTGVAKDEAEAVKWYRKAAEQGDGDAQAVLGGVYAAGVAGVAKDTVEGLKWIRKGTEQGTAAAQFLLGCFYAEGTGVAKDEAEAVKWYRKAAEQGNAAAQSFLSSCYADGTGVAKDEAEAVKWYRKAAEQGDAQAQYNLGTCYASGTGVAKDEAEAVKWYRKAAEQGDGDAQAVLGGVYAAGVAGVAKDEAEAVKWYRKAAEQGNAQAQYNLGTCYAEGTGVAKDAAEAVKWYRKAADQGHEDAKRLFEAPAP